MDKVESLSVPSPLFSALQKELDNHELGVVFTGYDGGFLAPIKYFCSGYPISAARSGCGRSGECLYGSSGRCLGHPL
jgi:hypothetical protein